jgi:hypothetical protein
MRIVLVLIWLAFCYFTAPKFINLKGDLNNNRLAKTGIMFIAPMVALAVLKIIGVVINLTIMFIVIVAFAAIGAVAIGIVKGMMNGN